VITVTEEKIDKKFADLRDTVEKETAHALSSRISTNPYSTDLEYLLGAFIEMYQSHVQPILYPLYKKGYCVDVSSGFSGAYGEYQVINGNFTLDDIIKRKLEDLEVKFFILPSGVRSIKFWPKEANLVEIEKKFQHIVALLPDRGQSASQSMSEASRQFRKLYIPADPVLKRKRLFEILQADIELEMNQQIKQRRTDNPVLTPEEVIIGAFSEMIEPPVRDAVFALNKKGYSTDTSGFLDDVLTQTINGDFTLDDKTVKTLQEKGVHIEKNPSGYTYIRFWPDEPDIGSIKAKWQSIVELIPDTGTPASPSMTQRARAVRRKYIPEK
jgi:hypothetical protein